MAVGTIVMGIGFLFMAKASLEVLSGTQAALIWIILAYLFHTLGELSASPVALSFITKLAPAKYASIMMGVYFAATGLGNKVAGVIGESSQAEPIYTEVQSNYDGQGGFVPDTTLAKAGNIDIKGLAYIEGGKAVFTTEDGSTERIEQFVKLDDKNRSAYGRPLRKKKPLRQIPSMLPLIMKTKRIKMP